MLLSSSYEGLHAGSYIATDFWAKVLWRFILSNLIKVHLYLYGRGNGDLFLSEHEIVPRQSNNLTCFSRTSLNWFEGSLFCYEFHRN